MAAVEQLEVKEGVGQEADDVPDDVKEAGKVVAVWCIKCIVGHVNKKNKKQKAENGTAKQKRR